MFIPYLWHDSRIFFLVAFFLEGGGYFCPRLVPTSTACFGPGAQCGIFHGKGLIGVFFFLRSWRGGVCEGSRAGLGGGELSEASKVELYSSWWCDCRSRQAFLLRVF